MTYDLLREDANCMARWMVLTTEHAWTEKDEFDEFWDSDSGRYGASRTRWALCRTCKGIYAEVLPLIYKAMTFDGSGHLNSPIADPGDIASFMKRCRVDLVACMEIELRVGLGFAKDFLTFAKAIDGDRYLTFLRINFTILGSYDNHARLGDYAEVQVVCMYWRYMRVGGPIYLAFWDSMYAFWEGLPKKFRGAEAQRRPAMSADSNFSHDQAATARS
ncbi:hypothetical protein K461DRAFT_280427, partial [Myriangium duriaei CBS 260.36]